MLEKQNFISYYVTVPTGCKGGEPMKVTPDYSNELMEVVAELARLHDQLDRLAANNRNAITEAADRVAEELQRVQTELQFLRRSL